MDSERENEQDVTALAMKRVVVSKWPDGEQKEAALQAIDEKVADAIFGESALSEVDAPSSSSPAPRSRRSGKRSRAA
jgi:hypothetical protein